MNCNGQYLATAGKSGIIKIFEIIDMQYKKYEEKYDNNNILHYLRFMNETPIRVYNEHSSDIIDICWSNFDQYVLLSASMDHLVIMWNINNSGPVMKFVHSSVVTSISFCPVMGDDEKFASGCLDKIIRIWSPKQNKVLDYINMKEYITAISYFPTGDMIAIGTHDGKCSIYDCKPKLRYNFSFTCRNRIGKYSHGRKITNIHFLNRTKALITTNDSRIRLINISDGKMIHKYKGLVNEEFMIRAYNEYVLLI
jgi:WD40 repeat protein